MEILLNQGVHSQRIHQSFRIAIAKCGWVFAILSEFTGFKPAVLGGKLPLIGTGDISFSAIEKLP